METKILTVVYCSLALALFFLVSIGSNVVDADVADGLVSAWHFDGNLRDSAGNNHGEFMGTSKLPIKPTKPTNKSGPVHTADGVISTWKFDGDAKDDVSGNDGELITGKPNPPR